MAGHVTLSWYPSKADSHKIVPTWNYATVRAWGKPTAIENAAWLSRQLDDLTSFHESPRPVAWAVADAAADYIAAQMKAIVEIEIPITRLEGKFKMSQNRNEADRSGVIGGLRDEDDPHGNREMAGLVERLMGGA